MQEVRLFIGSSGRDRKANEDGHFHLRDRKKKTRLPLWATPDMEGTLEVANLNWHNPIWVSAGCIDAVTEKPSLLWLWVRLDQDGWHLWAPEDFLMLLHNFSKFDLLSH